MTQVVLVRRDPVLFCYKLPNAVASILHTVLADIKFRLPHANATAVDKESL